MSLSLAEQTSSPCATRQRLGIYCPGAGVGGPWRYVKALLRAPDLEDFELTLFSDCVEAIRAFPDHRVVALQSPVTVPASYPAAATGGPRATGETLTRSRKNNSARRFVPLAARRVVGFCRETVQQARGLRQHPLDLLHTQNTGCEESPLASRLAGVRSVLGTFHVDSTYDLQHERSGPTYRLLEWASNRALHQAIAVSDATKNDWVRRTGIPAWRITTIHNGIDPDQFSRQQPMAAARGRLQLPPEALVLGGLGRLDAAKGFSYLLHAVALLRRECENVFVAIAGTGELRAELEATASALGIADRISFLGFQADVNLMLDACDVFVLPSLCEALPFALLEAMAHELPCVGTTVGGVPEVIVPAETGFLCPPREAPALAAAIRPLLHSAALRQRFGHAGRQRVTKHFHEADMVRKTLDLYRRMLTRPASARKVACV